MLLDHTTVAAETTLPLPHIAPIPSQGDEWILLRPYEATIDGTTYRLPYGLRSDLASIPRPVSWLIQPHELSALAPYVHDALYRSGGKLPAEWVEPYRTFNREETDRFFVRIMELEHVKKWRRRAAFRGVRWFGGGAWNSGTLEVEPYLAQRIDARGPTLA